jgi:site-specific recombinase XerD
MTGMRLAELVGLDVDTVDLESGFLRVMGKGRKERLIPINSAARQLLHRWLAERPAPLPGCRALFLSRGGQRISRRTVQYLVRRAVKRAGLDPRISPHKLRHTFATHLYAEGTDLRDIQELLGHANIASTSIYTHTNVDRLRHAIRSLSDGIAD